MAATTDTTSPCSTHLPEVVGAIETVTGSLVVRPGLRNIQTVAVTLMSAPAAAAASVAGVLSDDGTQLSLRVVKADGVTPGDVAAKVAWLVVGK